MKNDHPLRRWRRDHGVTLAQLGEELSITPSHLSEIERGENSPSLELAVRLSQATGRKVKVEEFVRG